MPEYQTGILSKKTFILVFCGGKAGRFIATPVFYIELPCPCLQGMTLWDSWQD